VCFVCSVGNSWINQPIFFLDFEGSRDSGILEYGVATVLEGEVTEVRTRLCRPAGKIPERDRMVHGLQAEALTGFGPFADDWEFFAGLREQGPLAAHFSGVENSLLKSVWPYPRTSPDFARGEGRMAEWGPWVDTARLYGATEAGEGLGLEVLVERTGLQQKLDRLAGILCPADRRRYHTAPYDALAGAVLLGALARHPVASAWSVRQLLAFSTEDPDRREALTQTELFE